MDPFFSSEVAQLLGGPSIAGLPGGLSLSSSADSRATTDHTSNVSTPFVQSSPFILGNDNATGDVGTGGASASGGGGKAGLAGIADALGPAATLVALAVGIIALMKAMK